MADDTIKDAIIENATGPKSAEGDSSKVEQHDLESQIAADRYVKGQGGASTPRRGLRFSKMVPPGSV